MKNLALLGGKPVRNKPYPLHSTMFGKEEEGLICENCTQKKETLYITVLLFSVYNIIET